MHTGLNKKGTSLLVLFLACVLNFSSPLADMRTGKHTDIDIKVVPDALQISLEWGWASEVFDGSLIIENGLLDSFEAPLMDKGESVQRVSAREIKWNSKTVGPTDGVIVSISQCKECVLIFRFRSVQFTVNLIDILRSPIEYKIGKRGAKLVMKRLPKDIMRVKEVRDNFIFTPGEKWSVQMVLEPGIRSVTDMPATLRTEVHSENNRGLIDSRIELIKVSGKKTFKINITSPVKEGVYKVLISIDGLPVQIPQRVIQFIVLDPSHNTELRSTTSQEGQNRKLVDQVNTAQFYGGDRYRSDGSDSVVGVADSAYRVSGTRAERAFKSKDVLHTMNWFAYKLKIQNPGVPHILQVVYPKHVKQRFVVSIIDRNDGRLAKSVLDYMITSKGGSSGLWESAEIVFWPKQEETGVVIVNTLPGAGAAVKSLKLFEVQGKLKGGFNPLNEFCENTGVYFEEVRFDRSLGGKRVLDPGMHTLKNNRSDWNTWYQTITNLVKMMDYYGYNEALIPVYGYGASIYPSQYLGQSTNYDDGIDFSDGRDPVKKDIVRMILTIFERANKKLIPVYEFYSKVDELEKIRISNGLDLINNKGKTSREALKLRTAGPFYNPLHPATQSWVRNVLSEFVGRYGDSSALGNIALQLNTTSWLHYPGLSWGYDAQTFKRFLGDMKLSPDVQEPLTDAVLISEWINKQGLLEEWLNWRNQGVADLFRHVATDLEHGSTNRDLILLYMNIFSSRFGDREHDLKRNTEKSLRILLSRRGVDPKVLSVIPGVKIARPVRLAIPWQRASERRSAVSVNKPAETLFYNAGAEAFVSFHDYFETKVASIDDSLWWRTDYWMVASNFSEEQLRPLQRQKWKNCYDGGWQVPQYKEDMTGL